MFPDSQFQPPNGLISSGTVLIQRYELLRTETSKAFSNLKATGKQRFRRVEVQSLSRPLKFC